MLATSFLKSMGIPAKIDAYFDKLKAKMSNYLL